MEDNIEDKYKHHIFKVYKNEFLTIVGNIYVIITTGTYYPNQYDESIRFGEYFVLFPDKELFCADSKINIISKRIIFPTYNEQYHLDSNIVDKQKYFLDQAQEMCEIAIQNLLNLEYKNSNTKIISLEPLKLIILEQTNLLGLWMRDKCKSEFDEILKYSKCVILTKYIRKIKKADKFRIEDVQVKES